MQQLEPSLDALCLVEPCFSDAHIERAANHMALVLSGKISEICPGADVWFAMLNVPQGTIHLHYDQMAECFWLTPTGALAQNAVCWAHIQQLVGAK
ncbi:hypothetical protein [Echinimonas agarilytica]|uniref:Uncharacterized protein n=1 Tax=Echinimonas agarilytica TaxID=1215918 RepID=A0AA42B662_9GAMM|nr:hypothetical protein [Echinimonas agarilytica]MCM2678279.1 hypothetical protein [Echinimonas agarilytica]